MSRLKWHVDCLRSVSNGTTLAAFWCCRACVERGWLRLTTGSLGGFSGRRKSLPPMSSRSCRGSPESHSIQHSGRPGCRCHWGFGYPDRHELMDWVIRTVCRLDGEAYHVPVAKPSEHVRQPAKPSENCNGRKVQDTCPPPGKAGLVTQGIGVRSHKGYILLELWASSLTRLYLAHATGPRPPAFVRDRSGSG